jgi:hypothetical protein
MTSNDRDQGEQLDGGDITSAVTSDLLRRQRAGERVVVEIGPWSAWMMVTSAQAVVDRMMRPGDELAAALREAVAEVEQALAGTAAGEALAGGWRELRAKGHQC